MANFWKLYWTFVAVTLADYFTMIFWSLPKISSNADGLAPFDMRPGGYTFSEAQEFLAALAPDMSAFYRDIQLPLDTAYPAMLAIVLGIGLWRLSRGSPTVLRVFLIMFPIVGSIADYLENIYIAEMLSLGVDGITVEIVAISSQWTLIKSGATTVGMVALLILLILRLIQTMKKRSLN